MSRFIYSILDNFTSTKILKQKLGLVRKVMKDFNFHFMDVTKVQLINLTIIIFEKLVKKSDIELEKEKEEKKNERRYFF